MRNLLTILLAVLSWTNLFAQSDSIVRYDSTEIKPLEISEDNIREFLNDDAFNYETAEPKSTWWDAVMNWFYNILRSMFEWIFGVEQAGGYLAIFLKILPYLLLALFLYLVIRFFIKVNARSLSFNETNLNMVILS